MTKSGKEIVNMQKVLRDASVSYDEMILWCERMKREEEAEVQVHEVVRAWPLDGAHSLQLAIDELFGWTMGGTAYGGFMGMQKMVQKFVSVETSYGEYKKVPWGPFLLPDVEGQLQCGMVKEDGIPCFLISGTIKKRSLEKVQTLANLVRAKVKEFSLYRGKALIFEPAEDEETNKLSLYTKPPGFFKLNGLGKEDLILPRSVFRDVNAAVFSLIEDHAEYVKRGKPTRRSIVLNGDPGTGKTLTMAIAAGLCVKQQRTFMLLKDANFLEEAIKLANNYNMSPALISVEDIDRRMHVRDDDANRLLNAIDGVDSKNLDIFFLLTTNHADQLIDTFKRAGRSDMIITLPTPDAEAAGRLLRKGADNTFMLTDQEYLEVGRILSDALELPANIVEVCNRAVYYQIAEKTKVVDFEMLKDIALAVTAEKRQMLKKEGPKIGALESLMMKVDQVHDRVVQ